MIWVDKQAQLDKALEQIADHRIIAIDTEADSLHSYFDKVCLIQISDTSDDFVIDPLARIDIARFGKIIGDPSITKVLHGADYDLRILNRDFGFVMSGLIDTMVSAQLLGYEAYGLAALLERHFNVKVNKAHQRADWAMRPLPPDMLEYAAMDTRFLVPLAAKLREELVALGRWEWAVEEFGRLEAIRFRDASEDEEPWRKIKNISGLDRRGLAVLRDLHRWRDALARKADRPPFKIIGNDAMVDIAREKPESAEALGKLKSVAQYHRQRYGRDLVEIVQKAAAIAEADLPQRGEPKQWLRDKALENRINLLKRVRDKVAADLKIDSGLLAPRHVLSAIATTGTLDDIPALRRWQRELLEEKLMTSLGAGK